ncbi:HAMP domain-containing histidine kinase [Streptomyces canus]|uniref:sensor histidine kinase n=1 Tax=Streptomyces canus TaxID=58343 RepID=UPI002E2E3D8E|nr:HAMP domain-containing sensor histidine kinase [Streptomyces canus]
MRTEPAVHAETPETRVPLHRSLLVRLLASSLLVALCAITATAWLAVRTTTSAIRQEQGQVLSDDTDIYKTLTDYAAVHPSWDGVTRTISRLADRTNRRITLTAQDHGRRTIADSAPGTSPLPDHAFAVIDPLQVDPALFPDAGADRIDPRVLGPFRLSAAQRQDLLRSANTIRDCIRKLGLPAKVSVSLSGHPSIETGDDTKGAYALGNCKSTLQLALTTPGELKALDSLNKLIRNCLAHQGRPAVVLDLTLSPKPGDADTPAARNCVNSSRREQLAAYVAPAAQLFVSEPAGSAVPGFDLSQANTIRIIGVVALVLVLTMTVTVVIGVRLVRPLRALTSAVRNPGRPQLRVPVTTGDEIGRLTAAFNDLSEHRERTEAQRKAMVSDIAHELRTPLSTIRSWLEATQDGVLTPDDDVTSVLLEETLLLQHIIDDLRDLAAAEAGTLQLHRELLDAGDLLHHVATAHGGQAQSARITLDVRTDGDTELYADPMRLRQAVGNLVSNAVRHTPPGGSVTVRSRRTGNTVLIQVSDTGSGIGPEDLPHVFDRFWRAEKSRNRHTGGSGLGLSIARRFTEAHGGSLSVTSSPGTETVFTLQLPG